jgi:hypothetical protein
MTCGGSHLVFQIGIKNPLSSWLHSSWRLASDFSMLLSSWLHMLLNRHNARIYSGASIGSIPVKIFTVISTATTDQPEALKSLYRSPGYKKKNNWSYVKIMS